MPYIIPNIHGYKPFYIQTEGDLTAWDTTTYGMVAMTQPFPGGKEAKEPYKNDWFDEHGDDEYVPGLKYKAFEYTVKFYIKATPGQNPQYNHPAIEVLESYRTAFRNKLAGGEFKIWDSWQYKGFQNVRFVKDEIETREVTDDYAWVIFSVTFKINDPYTVMTYGAGTTNEITPVV